MKNSSLLYDELIALGLKVLDADTLANRDTGFDRKNFDAGIAVAPKNLNEVCTIVKFCIENQTSIVPHGGRTGLAGGGISKRGQIILMMDQMNTIREIDPASRIAIVDAGVKLQELDEIIAAQGLTVGIDLASRGSCTIGGMVATNAGGGEAFRNGVMRNRVLGLEAILPDSTILHDLKKVVKANEGYDIKQLLIGSEGTLGIITGVTLKLEKAGDNRKTVLMASENASKTLEFFDRLSKAFGPKLLYAEIMWRDYFETVGTELGLNQRFGQMDGNVYFISEIELGEDDEELLDVLGAGLEGEEISDAVIAKNEQERNEIWSIRESSFLIDKCYPGGCWFDISIPLPKLDRFVSESVNRIHAVNPSLRIFTMGHLGDGNLHYTINANDPVEHLYPQISEALYSGLNEIGGSFSAEHGIGTEKQKSLEKFGDPGKLMMMKSIKKAIDPLNIMNPGKVVPDN